LTGDFDTIEGAAGQDRTSFIGGSSLDIFLPYRGPDMCFYLRDTENVTCGSFEKKNINLKKFKFFNRPIMYEHASIYTDVQTVLMSYVTQKINVTCGS
jgi:hypothetical protein